MSTKISTDIERKIIDDFATEIKSRAESGSKPEHDVIEFRNDRQIGLSGSLQKKNDVVLDPFTGSGTTAVSAVLHGRKYVGIELKPEYFEEAVKNIEEAEKLMRPEKNKVSSKN